MKSLLKNFGFRRKSGILLPISSLPSAYGIGGFGSGAYDFVDFLERTETACWQVLPLNPTSYGDSPYQSPASMAGNPYSIDPETLFKKGLITRGELNSAKNRSAKVDYGWLFETRYPLLRCAFARFCELGGAKTPEYKAFIRKNRFYINDYALFMALKVHYGFAAWTEWAPEHREIDSARRLAKDFAAECDFWRWVQFEFYTEWSLLRAYAKEKGVLIIGDMPIYVAYDSMDVWRAPEQFMLNDDFVPTVVAGCPPDAFSDDGQLWGNPIYNWERMKESGFAWWCERVRAAFNLYDILRIDHFRGFAGYYCIPYGHPTAQYGSWESAPGTELFDKINSEFSRARIIAEDLGLITSDVRELLSHTGFPGMKMLQFAFYDDDNEYLPRTYTSENCVAYPGSHDADCIRSWVSKLDKEALVRFKKECPHRRGQSRTYDLIELALSSSANLAVVPIQDYLELPNEVGRMNTPSVAQGNWTYRLSAKYASDKLINNIRDMTLRTHRSSKNARKCK